MKKAFLVLAAVLLAVMFVGCDNTGIPETTASNIVGYTEDGGTIIELEIGVGLGENSRALATTLAKAGVDFYEVVFVDNGSAAAPTRAGGTYRTSWKEGKVAKINVPTGTAGVNYNNTATGDNLGSAYILAGRASDKTLLAVGTISSATTITSATSSVTFTLEPFKTDIAHATAPTLTASTGTITLADTNTVLINEQPAPVFLISNTTATALAYNLDTPPASLSAIMVDTTYTAANSLTFLPFLDDGDIQPADKATVALSGLTASTGGATPVHNPLTFPLTITITPTVATPPTGLAKIYFSIPVYLVNKETSTTATGITINPVEWYFKGGLKNTLIDMGPTNLSQGGAILIGFGDIAASAGSKEIIVNW